MLELNNNNAVSLWCSADRIALNNKSDEASLRDI